VIRTLLLFVWKAGASGGVAVSCVCGLGIGVGLGRDRNRNIIIGTGFPISLDGSSLSLCIFCLDASVRSIYPS